MHLQQQAPLPLALQFRPCRRDRRRHGLFGLLGPALGQHQPALRPRNIPLGLQNPAIDQLRKVDRVQHDAGNPSTAITAARALAWEKRRAITAAPAFARSAQRASSSSRVAIWAAIASGVSPTRASVPFCRRMPSLPIGVVTTGNPTARLATILPFTPAPNRSGFTDTRASA